MVFGRHFETRGPIGTQNNRALFQHKFLLFAKFQIPILKIILVIARTKLVTCLPKTPSTVETIKVTHPEVILKYSLKIGLRPPVYSLLEFAFVFFQRDFKKCKKVKIYISGYENERRVF